MRIKAPPEQSWALTLDEVALVRNHIAKGSTDEELKFCLAVARRRKLDPFKGQIWFVKRRDSTAQGGYRWIPITGIDGLLHLAARDHRDFGTVSKPKFGPMHKVTFSKNGQGRPETMDAPEWAEVTVWKKGSEHPSEGIVYWDEIYPNIDYSPLVRQMPRLMLGKCATAQAIRRTYPDTGGMYIPEEMQGPPEFTPGGRTFTVAEPQAPGQSEAETNWQRREREGIEKLNPAQREIVERKIAESKSSQDTQPAKGPGANTAEGSAKPASKPLGAQPTAPVPERALTYLWIESDQEALIDGNAGIKRELQQLLGKYVKPPKFEIRVNGDELEAIKYELKTRGVAFIRRYPKV